MELNGQEPRNTFFHYLVKERIKSVEFEEENGKLMFVTTTEILYDFNKYRRQMYYLMTSGNQK